MIARCVTLRDMSGVVSDFVRILGHDSPFAASPLGLRLGLLGEGRAQTKQRSDEQDGGVVANHDLSPR